MSPSDSQPRLHVLHVKPRLPEVLDPLRDLALNLRWVWHKPTADLFRRLDPNLWEATGHNPELLLSRIDQHRLDAAAADPGFLAHLQDTRGKLAEYLGNGSWYTQQHPEVRDSVVAYFSAEFGITECLPFYSGGLGVLAGDHLKSASELGIPLVGVGLAYREGYFIQYLNADGWQQESYPELDFYNLPMEPVTDDSGEPVKVGVPFPGRSVLVQIWRLNVGRIPLYLLDTNVAENSPDDRDITRRLYGGDRETRIRQEIVLGIGGLRALRVVGIRPDVCHMNEGHAAFLGLERTRQIMEETGLDYHAARPITAASSIFTTHTPVPAGFDIFEADLVERYLGDLVASVGLKFPDFLALGQPPGNHDGRFNMALFAVRHSAYRNGVSKLHGRVTRDMMASWWPGYPVNEVPVGYVTNGVHLRSWIAQDLQDILNRVLGPYWSENPKDEDRWQNVQEISDGELWQTHLAGKRRLVEFTRKRLVDQLAGHGGSPAEIDAARRVLDPERLTIGFARRFVTYKRATLILSDLERLKTILRREGMPVQFVFAGKAHPADQFGKEIIKSIVHFSEDPELRSSVVFIEGYDINVARHLVQGVDVWLNTPRRPLEASGTSGMKAAANGVLNLSVLDGWWDEGFDNEVGWAVGLGERYDDENYQDRVEANALYDLLEREVVPLYYNRDAEGLPSGWLAKMRAAMMKLCPRFNTNRMVGEYARRFYLPAAGRAQVLRREGSDPVRAEVAHADEVAAGWPGVAVEEVVQEDGGGDLQVGTRVPVRVRVRLGALRPEDVRVELYHGITDGDHRVPEGAVTELEPAGEGPDGTRWFSGNLLCTATGLYGYQVRVRPRFSDTALSPETPLIRWY